MNIYLTFYEMSFKNDTLKPKIEKRALLPLFTVFVKIFAGEKSQSSVQVIAYGDHIVLISQNGDICFSLYIKQIIIKCKKILFSS